MKTTEQFFYLDAYRKLLRTEFEDFEKIDSFKKRSVKGIVESILLSLTVLKYKKKLEAKERFLEIAKLSGIVFAMIRMQLIEKEPFDGDVYGAIDLWVKYFEESLKKAKQIAFGSKRDDYNSGGVTLSDYWILEELSLVSDCWKKALRLKSLFWSDKEPQNESIEDNLIDLINYAIFGYVCLSLKQEQKRIDVKSKDSIEMDGLDFNV